MNWGFTRRSIHLGYEARRSGGLGINFDPPKSQQTGVLAVRLQKKNGHHDWRRTIVKTNQSVVLLKDF